MKRINIYKNGILLEFNMLFKDVILHKVYGYVKIVCILIIGMLIISACSDDFLERAPLHVPDETTFWQTENDAQTALNQLYQFLPSSRRYWTECYSDNAIMTNAWGERGMGEIKQGGLAPTTGHIQSWYGWSEWRYNHVRHILYFLDNLSNVDFADESVHKRMEGEARFILAEKYFRMSRYWGDLPLIKEKPLSLDEANEIAKSPQEEVFDYILENINKAIQYIPDIPDRSGRITRSAAYMLKANILMWQASLDQHHGRSISNLSPNQLWRQAANSAQRVIQSGHYSLYDDITTLFYSSTNNLDNETILARQYVEDRVTNWINMLGAPGGVSLRGGGWASFSAPRNLVDAYECSDGLTIYESPLYNVANPWENRDRRLTEWFMLPKYPILRQDGTYSLFESHPSYASTNREAVGGEGGGGRSGYWCSKYVEMDSYFNFGYQNWIIYRYAETLLILAEALNESDPLNDSIVWSINKIRTRAELPGLDHLLGNSEEMRQRIWHERRVELVNEEKRYFDLLRTKQAEIAMNPPGNRLYGINADKEDYDNAIGDWTKDKIVAEPIMFDASRGYLWPVPQDVIDRNPNITQNPGW